MQRWISAILALWVVAIAGTAMSSQANAGICQRLWTDRNAIYKAHGYCFHSWRARALFGNDSCEFWYDAEVPLSPRASAHVAYIIEQEFAYGCRGWAPPGY